MTVGKQYLKIAKYQYCITCWAQEILNRNTYCGVERWEREYYWGIHKRIECTKEGCCDDDIFLIVIHEMNLLWIISDLLDINIRRKKSIILYIVCLLHRQNNQSSQDIYLYLTACWFLHFSFFFVLQSTIILSEFKHNVTSTGQNASLIHCARLLYMYTLPTTHKLCKTNPLINKGRTIKIQNGFRPNTQLTYCRSLFLKYPPRKLKTCSSGYKTKRVGLCSCQFKWTQLNWVKATTTKNTHPLFNFLLLQLVSSNYEYSITPICL